MQHQVPLIYFHGIVPGLYAGEWPVFIVGDDPGRLTFTACVDERRFAHLGGALPDDEPPEIRRRYVTRLFRHRLHQTEFRERVVRAYQHHCAVCRLKRDDLLEAAHIVPDADPLGSPSVPNGVALCRLHHAAFDRCLIGINPDYIESLKITIAGLRSGDSISRDVLTRWPQLSERQRFEVASLIGNAAGVNAEFYSFRTGSPYGRRGLLEGRGLFENPADARSDTSQNLPDPR